MSMVISRELDSKLQPIGTLDEDGGFTYDSAYLGLPHAKSISFSLPLQSGRYSSEQASPYFRGLLPEGNALAALASRLGKSEKDYLGLLAECGLDCVGDVVINADAFVAAQGYKPFSVEVLRSGLWKGKLAAPVTGEMRLSLAGTQDKMGLYHRDDALPQDEWYEPIGGAPSNYILKFPSEDLPLLMVLEQVTMMCARSCGLKVAESFLIDLGRPAIAVKRFDRLEKSGLIIDGIDAPARRHQEDFSQIFGVESGSKYGELHGGTLKKIAEFLDDHSSTPALDKREMLFLLMFNYVIGNCDNHLKNSSVLYSPDWSTCSLAPAYDLVATTYYGRFSRNMAFAIGSTRNIDEVTAEDFALAAGSLGVSRRALARLAKTIIGKLTPALTDAVKALSDQGFSDEANLAAEGIAEDMQPRLRLLEEIATKK